MGIMKKRCIGVLTWKEKGDRDNWWIMKKRCVKLHIYFTWKDIIEINWNS